MQTIAFFNSTLNWGGGEKWHLDIASALAHRNFRIVIFAHKNGVLYKRALQKGLSVRPVKINNRSFLNPLKLLQLKRQLMGENIDTIILNLPADLKTAGKAAKMGGIRRIIYRRGSAIPIRNTHLNRKLFHNVVTDILANSQATKATINANTSLFPEDRIKVIYNGLHQEAFQSPIDNVHNPLRIGHLGRFAYQKNHEFLIKIARQLRKQNIDVEWHLGGDGEMFEQIRSEARNAGLDNMTFHGFINDSKAFLSSVDLFVLPSHWEGFGYVIAEAMAVGKPVVAFNVSSNPELIKHNQTGLLLPKEDEQAFVNALNDLTETPEKITLMGKNAHAHMQNNFTFALTIKQIVNYLDNAGRY